MDTVEKIPSVLPYAFAAMVVLISFVLSIKLLIKRFRKGESNDEQLEEKPVERHEASWPKCVCGANASHAAPRLVRSRTGWGRGQYAEAPTYKRSVNKRPEHMDDFVFCETHAHVADSMMDRFIYERIRAVQAEANEKISIEASAFERELLIGKIKATLDDRKKRLSEAPKGTLQLLTGTGD